MTWYGLLMAVYLMLGIAFAIWLLGSRFLLSLKIGDRSFLVWNGRWILPIIIFWLPLAIGMGSALILLTWRSDSFQIGRAYALMRFGSFRMFVIQCDQREE